ncbi:MAG: hypothetical protein ACOCTT_04180 [archaeon]
MKIKGTKENRLEEDIRLAEINMVNEKKINTLEHKDFKTDFYITDKVKEFLEDKGIEPGEIKEIKDTWIWYEA